ncbi:hypothetical protein [Pantoea ananatis]|uniref:hypothetical protein n=1 Tax=Pantoea ananas TaxID=553 RepID=UPI001B31845B|nr:hypothetical protein [Pantoea ananatis]
MSEKNLTSQKSEPIASKDNGNFICSQAAIIGCCSATLDLVIDELESKAGAANIASILHLIKMNLDTVNNELSIFELKNF